MSSSFTAFVTRAWDQNRLLTVLLELTYACNWNCQFCYNDRGIAGTQLSTAQWLSLLDELQAMGTLNVVLSGGEPMAHRDFFAIGAHARRCGFVVRLKTNAHRMDAATAARVKREIDPFVVEVSLHGASASVHDAQTRTPGSFARLMENIPAMLHAGLRVRVNSTLTRLNEAEVAAMYAICDALDVPLRIDPDVTPRDNGDASPLNLSASAHGLAEWMRVATARAGAAPAEPQAEACSGTEATTAKHCGAGSASAAVDPVGNVLPCVQWRRVAGNLHTATLADIWQRSTVLADVRGLGAEVQAFVAATPFGRAMNYCPGNAESNLGSPVGVYPAAARRLQLARGLPIVE